MIPTSCGCNSGGNPKTKKTAESKKQPKTNVRTNGYKDLDKKTSLLFIKSSKCGYCQDFDKKYWSEWSKLYNDNINIVSFDPMKVKYRDPFLEEILKITFAVPSIYYIKYRENSYPIVKSIDYTNHNALKKIMGKKH